MSLINKAVARATMEAMKADLEAQAARIATLEKGLERIRARADEWAPEGGFEARIAWIEVELDDEPNRMPYGRGDEPPCRNGYEASELIAEHAGLIARALLNPTPTVER